MTDFPYAGEFSRMLMDLGYEESASRLKQFGRSDDIPFLDISKALLADERFEVGVAYSGMCLTSLPHKKFGVPYGARARMILIYLMSEA